MFQSPTPRSQELRVGEAVPMQHEYGEKRNGVYYVAANRVSLASIIHEYRDGAAAGDDPPELPDAFVGADPRRHRVLPRTSRQETEAYLLELKKKWDELERAAKRATAAGMFAYSKSRFPASGGRTA